MSTSALNIYFVDAGIVDLDSLIAGLPVGAEVHLLDGGSDGLSQMLAAIGGRSGLGSIQILSHGASGQLQLGSAWYDSSTLAARADDFAALGRTLGADGDILLYGCNVAAGDAGQAFIAQLASLTGADVAASEDTTGASALGGDWTLEASTGSIEAEVAAPTAWDGTLFSFGGYNFQTVYSGALTTSDPINAFRAGCYWDRYTLSNVANNTDVAIYMGDSALDDFLQIERNGSILIQDDDSGDGERSYDAFLHWSYQAGDVIRVTSYSTAIPTGSYKLYVSVNTTVTDIGSDPPPPANVAPTFSAASFNNGNTLTDTAADDSYPALTGNLHASDPDSGTMSYSGGGTGTYGSLSVSSNGSFTFTANDAAVEGLLSSTTQSFSVAVSDGQGGSASSTISFNINGVNDAIVANNDSASAYEARGNGNSTAGTNPSGNVLSNDSDRDSGDGKTVSSITGNIAGTYGTLNLASNGAYTYTVNNANAAVEALKAGQTLTDSFTYTARDNAGSTSNATLTVTINGYNDNPTAVADAGTVVEAGDLVGGTVSTPSVLLNDYDGDSGETAGLSVNAYTLTGSYGTLTLAADGTYSYAVNNTLAAVQALRTTAHTLSDVFTYTVKDVNNTTGSANLTITIQGSNDNPFGVDDAATAIERSGTANGSLGANGIGNVLTNDTDVDSTANGETKAVTLVRAGSMEGSGTEVAAGVLATGIYGTLTLNANGSYTYAVTENNAAVQALQTGGTLIDYFNYTVSDTAGGTDTALLAITIQGRNDAPVFSSAAASVALDDTSIYDTFTNATGTVTGSDVDSAGTSFDIRGGVVSGGSASLTGLYGTLSVVTATGAWTYQPNAIAINALPSGATTDTFQFRITDTQGLSALQTFTVNLTGADDTPLSLGIADQSYTGGAWQYQVPSAAFTDAEGGAMTFTAQLVDSAGVLVDLDGEGENNPAGTLPSWLSFNATTRTFSGTPPSTDNTDIYLKVTASDGNSAASDFFKLDLSNTAPTTTDDSLSMAEEAVRLLTLADFGTYADAENDAFAAIKIIAVPTGTFELSDGIGGWTSITNGQLITVDDIAAGKLRYAPTGHDTGTPYTTLTFQVSDGSDFSSTHTLTINVNNVNDAPTGSATVSLPGGFEDIPYTVSAVDLLTGFTDLDSDTLSVTALTADHGSVVNNGDGTYTITPTANYNGAVTLGYSVIDGNGGSVAATQTFTLAAVNDAPALTTARATLSSSTEDGTGYSVTAVQLLQGFSDADGTTLTISGNSVTADHGSFATSDSGVTYVYTAEVNYNGPVTLSYTVTDGTTSVATTQTLTLTAVNDAPTGLATAVLANATENQSYLISTADLLQGFSDVDGDTLTLSGLAATLNVGGASAGSLVNNGNGTYTFTPNANVNGQVNLIYAVNDGHTGTVSGTRSFTITADNSAPALTGAPATLIAGTEDTAYTVSAANLLQGFTDADGDTPAISSNLVTANHGTVVYNSGDNSYTITPDADYNGVVTLSYAVTDGLGGNVAATQSVTLAAANDAPSGATTTTLPAATEGVSYLIRASDLLQGLNDVDGDSLSVINLTATLTSDGASAGTLVDNGNSTWTLTPSATSSGEDAVTLNYTVTDLHGGTVAGTTLLSVSDVPGASAPNLAPPIVGAVTANTYTDVFSTDDPLLSGFTSNVRVTVSTGTGTVRLSSLPDGVTSATGYTDALTGASSIAFEGTQAAVNDALLNLQVNTATNATLSINASTTGMAFNATTGHYYQAVSHGSGISWTDARDAAAASTFNGLTGYLATITSADENAFVLSKLPADGWIGASDSAAEGTWKWVTGPEEGTTFSTGNNTPTTVTYANWNAGEPNDAGGEDYAEFYATGSTPGQWNDLPGTSGNGISYYVVEYGGIGTETGTVSQSFTVPVAAGGTAPVITTSSGSTVTLTEAAINVAPANLGLAWTVADTDQNYTAGILRVAVNGGGTSDETLSIQNVGTSTGQIGISGLDVTYENVVIGTVPATSGGSGIGGQYLEVTLNAAATDAAVSALIAALQYGNTSNTPPASRTLDVFVKDDTNLLTTAQVTVTITASNDAPTASDDSITTPEDIAKVLSLADFGNYTDPDLTTIASVKITTLESAGSLEYNSGSWTGVTQDQVITAADITAGKLRFVPAADANGAAYATVGFQVGDGTDFSPFYTLTVNVTAVNDAPIGSASATLAAGTENADYVVTAADLLTGFSDVDGDVPAIRDNLVIANHGTVSYSGGDYTITPESNYDGPVTLSYTVTDGHGGTVSASQSFMLASVNSIPTSTNDSITTPEDTTVVLSLADFGTYADVDSSAIAKVQITTLESAGSLEYNTSGSTWVAVTENQEITAADITAGKLRFVPAADASGAPYDTVGFKVSDGTDYSASAYTLTVNVTAVNDAPTGTSAVGLLTPGAGAAQEDTAFSLTKAQLLGNFTDVEGTALSIAGLSADNASVTTSDGGTTYTFTPSANFNGTLNLSYRVTDGTTAIAASASVAVAPVNDAPALTAARATLSGGNEDATGYTVTAAALLQGFTDADGTTPTILGHSVTADHGSFATSDGGLSYVYTPQPNYHGPVTLSYQVTDGTASVATTQTFNLNAVGDAPTVANALADQSATQNAPFVFTLPTNAFADVDAGTVLTYSAALVDGSGTLINGGSLPDWLSFNAATATFSGTPANGDVTTAAHHIKVTASDGSFTISDVFDITVANVNDAPVLVNPIANQVLATDTTFSLSLVGVFSDADVGDSLTYSVKLADGSDLPSWLVFTPGTMTLAGNPPAETPYLNLKFTATDGNAASAFTTFSLGLQQPIDNTVNVNTLGEASITGTAAENSVLTAHVTDADTAGTPSYQWQTSSDAGSTWTDVPGTRAQASTFTLTQAEVGKLVRVQAFFTDAGGHAESPVSPATAAIANVNDVGTVLITGNIAEGQVLTATVSDADGLTGVTINYQWWSSTNGTDWSTIGGATSREFVTTSNEGGKYMRVVASYTDEQNSIETPLASTVSKITAGARAPVGVNDTGAATEKGGTLNATVGINAGGNLLGNDTDANDGETHTVASVRLGSIEGLGTAASLDGGNFVIAGTYGVLTVNPLTGDYTYVVNENDASVQALTTASTPLQDEFNYTNLDQAGLSDRARLTINISGANDAPVAGNNTGAATEAGGLANATAGSNATGDVLTNATDVDTGASLTIATFRTGGTEGAGTSAAAGVPLAGLYGTLTINANGTYTYVVNDANPTVQALKVGDTLAESFNYTVSDGTLSDTGVLTLTIHGANDAPVVSNATFTGAVEDGGLVSGTAVTGTDVDDDAPTVFALVDTSNINGSLTFNADGTWSYNPGFSFQTLSVGTHQDISFTYTATDSHGLVSAPATQTIRVAGVNDAPIVQTNILYQQANEDEVFNFQVPISGAGQDRTFYDVDANDTLTYRATLNDIDEDTEDYFPLPSWLHFDTATATFTGTPPQSVLDEYLGSNRQMSKVYYIRVEANDGHGGTISDFFQLTISNVNDAPVISIASVIVGTVTEAGDNDAAEVVPGTAVVSGTLAYTDEDLGVDLDIAATWSLTGSTAGIYGSMAINAATGVWTYTLNNALPATQALDEGDAPTETFTARVTDNRGGYAEQVITVTVQGTNDAPVVLPGDASFTGTATEAGHADDGTAIPGVSVATGTFVASDVDFDATQVWSVASPTGTYGSIVVVPGTGAWTYTLNNLDNDTQALKEGQTVTETFTATITDNLGATALQAVTLTLTLTGTNDVPVVTSNGAAAAGAVEEAGNLDNGDVVAGTSSATGTLTSSDVDADATATWTGSATGTYGSFAITTGGVWTYTLDNADADTKALKEGDSLTETFTATVTDDFGATATQLVTITVTGTNDSPVVTSNGAAAAGAVEEAGNLDNGDVVAGTSSATGTLTSSDVDADATATWTGSATGTYGSFAITTGGVWTYTLDNADADTKALKEGDSLTETFTATVTDDFGATATQLVTITVTGTNDSPVVTSNGAAAAGAVEEAGNLDNGDVVAGTSSATGTLTSSDVDADATATWTGSATGTYGSFAITTGGVWTYTLDNADADTKALKEGDSLTETFTATVTDDFGATATQLVTITVTGTNDSPVVTSNGAAAAGAVEEAGNLDNGDVVAGTSSATGTLTSSDVDADATATWTGSATGTYGSFAITTGGVWTYTLDNADADTKALKEGDSLTETFTATVTDDFGATATQLVTITVTGTNDSPVVTSNGAAAAGAVEEAGNLDNGDVVAGTSSATGTLTSSDVDADATATWTGSATGTYGSFAITTGGVWTYTLDNADADTKALKEGDSLTETFTATVTDDFGATATQLVTITVTGTNDSPVVTNVAGARAGTVVEAGHLDDGTVVPGTVTASGTLIASDVDAGATQTWSLQGSLSATYGTMAIDSSTGVWTYTLDNSLPATQALKEGQAPVTQTYTARVTDDQGAYVDQTVTITINGTNDRPVVTASVINLTFTEDVVVNAGSGANSFSFVAPFSDVDTNATLSYTVTKSDGSALPSWLTATATNTGDADITNDTLTFSGRPLNSNVGAFDVKINATDEKGAVTSTTFTLNVVNVNDAPTVVRTIADVTMNENDVFSYTIPSHLNAATRIFNDIDLPYGDTLTYTAFKADGSALPSWLTFNPDTLTFSGTPLIDPDIGANDVRVTVTDSAGLSVFDVFKITVNNTNDAPNPINPALPMVSITGTVAEGQTLTANTSNLADDDGLGTLHYTWQIGSGSTWTTIGTDAATFTLTDDTLVNAANQGTQSIRVQVSYRDVRNALLPIGQAQTETVTSDPVTPVTLTNQAPSGSVILTNANTTNGVTAAAEDDVLTASNNLTDADGMTGATVHYQWQRDGVNIEGATHASYTLVQADVDALITAQASYTDDDGFTNTVASGATNAVINVNDLPITTPISAAATEASVTPVALNLLDGITDEDGDTPTVSGAPTYKVNGSITPVELPAGFTLTGTTLTVDPADGAFDYLAEGQIYTLLVEYFVTDSIGVPVAHTATITITGTNDAPVAAVATATASEDGALVTGSVSSTDVDVLGQTASYALDAPVAGLTMDADGTYSFNPGDAAYQSLAEGEELQVVASFTVTDDEGATSSNTLTITITGTNDAPVAAVATATATEDGALVTGSVTSTDVDVLGQTASYALDAPVAGLTMDADGTYSFNPGDAAYQSLAEGEELQVVASFTVTDDQGATSSNTLTITITGTNDAPVAAVATATATEDGALVTGSVSSTDVDVLGQTASYALDAPVAGLTMDADGTYSFNPGDAAYQSLAEGEELQVVASFTVTDDQGATSSNTLTITITGTNDAPVAAVATATATEDGALVTGSVTSSDVDVLGQTASYALDAPVAGLTMDADGTYSFNPGDAAYQSLAEGEELQVVASFTVTDDEGATSSNTLTITITGTNDAPVAAVATATATEDGALVTGSVSSTDVDVLGQTASYALDAPVAGLTMDADGTYSFNPGDAAYQSLAEGEELQVVASFTVTDDQGATSSNTLTITITGTNDAPVAAVATATATEDGALVTGSVTSTDVDVLGQTASYALDAPVAGLTMDADGTYSFNPGDAAYQSLAEGEELQVVASFTVTDDQGATSSNTLTITITGTNDAPVAAVATATASEDGALVTGSVTSTDVDVLGQTASYALDAPVAGLTMDADGTYSFNPGDAAYQSLAEGEELQVVASFTVTDDQGATSSNTLTITITGTNDAPVAAVATATATEDGALVTGSVSSTDVDVLGQTASYALDAPVAGLTMDADGTYSFNPGDAAYQSLAEGEELQVVASFTVTDDQGATSSNTLTITITGTNDAPVAAVATATASEDGALVTGSVSSTDVDVLGQTASYALDAPVAGLTMDADGTYSFNPGDAAYQSLAEGEELQVVASFTVTDDQGATSSNTLTITITGTNDAPVAAVATATATEDGALVTGSVTSTDVDVLGQTASYALDAPVAGLTMDADGTYSFNPGDAAYQSLAEGEELQVVASFTVTDDQGATSSNTLTITITGTNDAPVAAVATATATEDGALVTGSVTSSDVDVLGQTASYALDAPVAGLTMDADGTYSFNPGDAAYQSLAEGEELQVVASFTVTDDQGATSSNTLTITITGTNDAPVAAVATATATEDGALVTGSVSSTDVDVLGQTASYALDAPVAGLTMDADGTYSFNPGDAAYQSLAEGEELQVVASFTVTDDQGATGSNTLTITVTGTNDAAIITGDLSAILTENNDSTDPQTVGGELFSADVDGDTTFAAQAGTAGDYGTFSVAENGAWTYTTFDDLNTLPHENADEHFTVTSSDGTSIVVDIDLLNVNDAPVAINALLSQIVTAGYSQDWSYNYQTGLDPAVFSDPDGDTMTFSATRADGSPLPNWMHIDPATGTLSGRPAQSDVSDRPVVVKITASDAYGGSVDEYLDVLVQPRTENELPTRETAPDLGSTNEDTAKVVTVAELLAGFSDGDLDPVTIVAGSVTADHGTVVFNSEAQTYTITPTFDYNGPLTLSYQVTDSYSAETVATSASLTVTPVDDSPRIETALPDLRVTEGQSVTLNVTDFEAYGFMAHGFMDVEGSPLTYTARLSTGAPLPDWITFDGTTLVANPTSNLHVTTNVRITATDTVGHGTVSDVLQIIVAQVNDAPTLQAIAVQSVSDTSADDSFAVLSAGLIGTDEETAGASLSYGIMNVAAVDGVSTLVGTYGTLTVTVGGSWTYTPADGALEALGASDSPSETFTVFVRDVAIGAANNQLAHTTTQQLVINLSGANDTPTGILALTGTAAELQTLSADPAAIADRDGIDAVTFNYEWQHSTDGIAWSAIDGAANASTYTLADTLGGEQVRVVATYTDNADGSNSVASSAVTVGEVRNSFALTEFADAPPLYGVTNDLVDALDGNDIVSGGHGNDTLIGGGGNDMLYGNEDNDQLLGGNGDDWMHGGQGNDALDGGAGNDTLVGGLGNDTLTGGDGLDTADYSASSDALTINLSTLTGQVVSDSRGTDLLGGIENLVGGAYGDSLTGDTAANAIDGLAGNDTISGGVGADTLQGGDGNDTLYGNQDNDQLFGGNGDDWIHGGQGDDALDGGAGNDTLAGGLGNDTLTGGDGLDTADYSASSDALTINLSTLTGQVVSLTQGSDLLSGIENLLGGAYGDALTGDNAANLLNGLAGNDTISGGVGADTLQGGDGNDTLYGNQDNDQLFGGNGDDWIHGGQGIDLLEGGAGNDTLAGGLGNDTLTGGDGLDTADYSASSDALTINLSTLTGQVVSLTQGSDLLSGIENLLGGAYGDALTGDNAANLLNGLAGNDTISGGVGADTLQGGDGNDTLYGNQDNDQLFGGNGDDWIHGGQGIDLLEGGAGNDTIAGGLGNDLLSGGSGNDVFLFNTAWGAGNVDTITDFQAGDKIALSASFFTAFAGGVVSFGANLSYDTGTGALAYDADGAGNEAAVIIAIVGTATHPSLTQADFMLG
ncbi:MAG: VCBS domain-containing protein [Candidatus Accumulibacter sp. UW20]|jgi:VCBS repeat-containing protein